MSRTAQSLIRTLVWKCCWKQLSSLNIHTWKQATTVGNTADNAAKLGAEESIATKIGNRIQLWL
jgi:hypothetical protein